LATGGTSFDGRIAAVKVGFVELDGEPGESLPQAEINASTTRARERRFILEAPW
jgi:hypothetical protein